MYQGGLLSGLILVTIASPILAKECLREFTCNEASTNGWNSTGNALCSSHFGGFPNLETMAQSLAQHHLDASMKLLMIATQFSYWKTERPGFHHLFEKLSDSAFEDGVNILRHMASRGGRLRNFGVEELINCGLDILTQMPDSFYGGSELEALGRALDIERVLAEKTLHLMHISSTGSSNSPDGQFSHFLAEEVSSKHAKHLNVLAGHVNNLGSAISEARSIGADPSLMIYMYDTHVLG